MPFSRYKRYSVVCKLCPRNVILIFVQERTSFANQSLHDGYSAWRHRSTPQRLPFVLVHSRAHNCNPGPSGVRTRSWTYFAIDRVSSKFECSPYSSDAMRPYRWQFLFLVRIVRTLSLPSAPSDERIGRSHSRPHNGRRNPHLAAIFPFLRHLPQSSREGHRAGESEPRSQTSIAWRNDRLAGCEGRSHRS